MPRAAWQSNPGAYRCHSYCSWCLFSFLCSWRPVPPLGVSSLHTPPGCVGLSPPGHTCTLTRCGVVQYVSVGLVGWWGRVVVRPRPPRRAGATSILWPQKGRALVAVTWHNHMRPCACGVAHALDKGSGAACASGLGRSSSRRGCSRAGAPPSAPLLMSGFWSALCALARGHLGFPSAPRGPHALSPARASVLCPPLGHNRYYSFLLPQIPFIRGHPAT